MIQPALSGLLRLHIALLFHPGHANAAVGAAKAAPRPPCGRLLQGKMTASPLGKMTTSLVMTNVANWKDPPFLMGKLTISMAIFNSKLLVYQRVLHRAKRKMGVISHIFQDFTRENMKNSGEFTDESPDVYSFLGGFNHRPDGNPKDAKIWATPQFGAGFESRLAGSANLTGKCHSPQSWMRKKIHDFLHVFPSNPIRAYKQFRCV